MNTLICSVCGKEVIDPIKDKLNKVYCGEECKNAIRTEVPTNPTKIIVGYDYNENKDTAYEVINRVRSIQVNGPTGTITFKATINSIGEVKIKE